MTTPGRPDRPAPPSSATRSADGGRPERAPLPEDPWSLPPLGDAWEAALARGLEALDLELRPGARRALDAHCRLLAAWTAAINLTAVRDPEGIARLHVVDSLAGVALLRREAPRSPAILDLGSGGGMPGLPLAVALPAGRVALVDSIAKKVRFLDVAARATVAELASAGEPAPRVEAIAARSEQLAHLPGHRGTWDVVTARAVSNLAELVELGLPLLRAGGLLVCWKRDDGSGSLGAETAAAVRIARAVGAGPVRVSADPEPAIPGHRLVVYRKESASAERFPRTPAERRRAPDG